MSLLNHGLLRPETEKAIEALGIPAEQVADRWLGGWKARTLALEKAGRLLQAVKEQADREAAISSDPANSHLAGHELAQIYDLSPEPPA